MSAAVPPRSSTCRVCKSSYAPTDNSPRACRSHPGSLRGESARKGNWEGVRGPDSGRGDDLVYSWTCCGGSRDDGGCTVDRHLSYDD